MKKILLGMGLSALITATIVNVGKIVKNRTDGVIDQTEE